MMEKIMTALDNETMTTIVRQEISKAADDLKTAYGVKDPIAMVVIVCGPDDEEPDSKMAVRGHVCGETDALREVLYMMLMDTMED